jgi:excisionase family DNA binding protein
MRSTGENIPDSAIIVAFAILTLKDSESILSILQKMLSQSQTLTQNREAGPVKDVRSEDMSESWLTHSQAAHHLGISTNTLYRYAEQQKLESRKVGGRLQYRVRTLEQYKNQRLRPSRP